MHYLGQWGGGGPGPSWALKWHRAQRVPFKCHYADLFIGIGLIPISNLSKDTPNNVKSFWAIYLHIWYTVCLYSTLWTIFTPILYSLLHPIQILLNNAVSCGSRPATHKLYKEKFNILSHPSGTGRTSFWPIRWRHTAPPWTLRWRTCRGRARAHLGPGRTSPSSRILCRRTRNYGGGSRWTGSSRSVDQKKQSLSWTKAGRN